MRGHQHARLVGIAPETPLTLVADQVAVLVLVHVLTEVIDVAGLVLGEVVDRLLDQLTGSDIGDPVLDHSRLEVWPLYVNRFVLFWRTRTIRRCWP